jgi:integrase
VRHKYLDHNPLNEADRPRKQDGEKEGTVKILTPEQTQNLVESVKDPKYKALLIMAIMTGARQGELLGLKWSDIDWEAKQVFIKRTFNFGKYFDPKTSTSQRKVDLSPLVIRELRKWKLACPDNELDLIFPNEAGNPRKNKNMLKRHFHPALKAAGLPRFRFHDLRHTYASLLIHQGENIKYIQTQLGHSNPTVTLNIYAHLMKPTNQEAACRLESTVFGEMVAKW